jgi:hypothetical protein
MISGYLRRRWLDFRNGHGLYLGFAMGFVNFILIAYNFAIKKIPVLDNLFSNTLTFSLFFIAVYIPLSIIIGSFHRKHQYVVENEALYRENWIWAWIARYQIRQLQGKTTPEENDKIMQYLDFILKRHKKEGLMGLEEKFDEVESLDEKIKSNDKSDSSTIL